MQLSDVRMFFDSFPRGLFLVDHGCYGRMLFRHV